jgi:hypothetical protein
VVLQPLSTAGGAGGGGHGPALSVADELLMSEVDSGWKVRGREGGVQGACGPGT